MGDPDSRRRLARDPGVMAKGVGKVSLRARLTARCLPFESSLGADVQSASSVLKAVDIRDHAVVPVDRIIREAKLTQVVADGWRRQLLVDAPPAPSFLHPPLLLSARTGWYLRQDALEVFERAWVIDGARRLEIALRSRPEQRLPVTIVLGLDSDSERSLRASLEEVPISRSRMETRERVDTEAPRLHVGEAWTSVTIASDPFVVPTSRGYAPAILVRREGVAHAEHLLIGARSLALPLEDLRIKRGTLREIHVALKKSGPSAPSPYLVEVLE